MRWVILHGYSQPVNHSHLKGSSKGNTDNQGRRDRERERWEGKEIRNGDAGKQPFSRSLSLEAALFPHIEKNPRSGSTY